MADKDAPPDLDAVADELYRLPPARFTGARDAHARAARKAGDRALADRITALRKPTISAWAANLLARERHDEVGPLLRLGEALRQAHRELDGDQLRQLGRRQGELVRALSRQAAQLAADSGHRLTGRAVQGVEETLHAALADPEAGTDLTRGRLTRPLAATVDFTGLATTADGGDLPRRPPPKQPQQQEKRDQKQKQRPKPRRKPAKTAGGGQPGRRKAELRRLREEAGRAEEQARQAEREAEDLENDAAAAQKGFETAVRHHDEAQQHLDALLEQVKDAKSTLRAARDDLDQVRRRHRDAGKAARDARRRAGRAAARAEQLADGLASGS
ncbi:hypothetical protein [Actinacidiphila sp. bgisy167]|uniref:hypothetical protein n=1 Tax=Actinacidiphila sp. bgisy167 TaxID=3413797 RepID=UPI003D717B9E